MAFAVAANYGNLPNGVFSPTIFSMKAQLAFRKKAVALGITNNDYFGEIANKGDTVRILKEPEIVVNPLVRGTQIVPQDLEDDDFQLTIDQANYFAFKLDDIEIQQAHHNWMSMASDRAAYKMADEMDSNVLGYLSGYQKNRTTGVWTARTTYPGTLADETADTDELLSANKLFRSAFVAGGSASESVAVGTSGTYDVSPLQVIARMARRLDQANVDADGRWLVIDPVFKERLLDENSKYINNDVNTSQNAGGKAINGKIGDNIRGFRLYESQNLPEIGTGPDTADTNGSSANYGIIVAGHDSAVAAAQQINKTEKYRDPNSFADVVRGMNLYGRKILRPEAIVTVAYNSNVG
jgi:hypothetical protein